MTCPHVYFLFWGICRSALAPETPPGGETGKLQRRTQVKPIETWKQNPMGASYVWKGSSGSLTLPAWLMVTLSDPECYSPLDFPSWSWNLLVSFKGEALHMSANVKISLLSSLRNHFKMRRVRKNSFFLQ